MLNDAILYSTFVLELLPPDPTQNETVWDEHTIRTSRLLCTNIVASSVKKFAHNEHLLTASSFLFPRYKWDLMVILDGTKPPFPQGLLV